MSVPALKKVLEYITNTGAKDFRLKVLNAQTTSLVLKRSEVMEALADAVYRDYKLTRDQKTELKGELDKSWPAIQFTFKRSIKSTANREVLYRNDEIVIIQTGSKSNYGAINDAIMKPAGALYKPFWGTLMSKVRKYLIDNNKEIRMKEDFALVKDSSGKTSRKLLGTKSEDLSPGSLLNLGHYQGSNIQYLSAYAFKENIAPQTLGDLSRIMKASPYGASTYNADVDMVSELASKFITNPVAGDFKKTVTLRLEAASENQERGRTEEVKLRGEMVNYLNNVIKTAGSLDWINQESSDSPMQAVEKSILQAAKKAGARVTGKTNLDTKPSKTAKKETFKRKNTTARMGLSYVGDGQSQRELPMAVPSYLSLISLLNEKLPPQVRSNMGTPRLNNQTGRFSESARVTNITPTPQGFPSIEYTYQRSPYDVFDKTLGKAPWATAERDPSELVALSVRQLATQLGMRRFYTRRQA